jgi:ribosomal protein L11 methyltransferase|tara:strand:- start:1550 stop:2452 length:903 start_codon:yes stop_codon:yes gene_type:complete
MAWWQLSVQSSAAELEQTEDSLLELGAVAITLSDAKDEPLYEPLPGDTPIWQHSIVTGLFTQKQSLEALYDGLIERLPEHQIHTAKKTIVDDQDWCRVHLKYFKPIQCAEKLWIVPSWHEPPDPSAVNIQLDPGLAFGTGGHATTALCLSWLGEHDIQNQSVIDYGCGSGILAIAAFKLGAGELHSVDIDPQALAASRENASRNNIDPALLNITLPEDFKSEPVDLLMANILSGPLVGFAPKFAELVKSEGQILLSGILQTQANDIKKAYLPFFDLDPICIKEDWIRVSGTRRSDTNSNV